MTSNESTSNFSFLAEHDSLFVELALAAERAFSSDPNTTLIKLRQLGEVVAKDIAGRLGIEYDRRIAQIDLLRSIQSQANISKELSDTFHVIRRTGNEATHEYTSTHHEAIQILRMSWRLCVWYHQTFGKPTQGWKPGAFKTPEDPGKHLRELEDKVGQLERERKASRDALNVTQALKEAEAQKSEELKTYLENIQEEKEIWEKLAQEQEDNFNRAQKAFEQEQQRVAELQKQQSDLAKQQFKQAREAIKKTKWYETEEETRIRIDAQLRSAGWQADTELLTYKKGARPEKGLNKAIAEWPTSDGRADYILFRGLTPIAVVEAKRKNLDVRSMLPQAERYSRGFKWEQNFVMAWQEQGLTIAWPDEQSGHFHIPFVYSCNGNTYEKHYKGKSGIWFRDVRDGANLADAHPEFHTPDGLFDKLKRSKKDAEAKLKNESYAYLGLRNYQELAIRAVETTLENGGQKALLAMATGTGKTRTIIGLIYRFLKAERFKRILFLVDRTSLGNQAYDTFIETKLEQNKSLSQIYNIASLGDMQSEAETRVHVCTVQALVRRIDSDKKPPIDAYDCIIVDEAHRGYTLDQEMGEGEALVRDSKQYLSAYRRVIDYFDAFKVGLTATPAAHTTEVFGRPVYTYTYREAVIDDWLIDHEPPYQYTTELNSGGISFDRGDTVQVWDAQKSTLDTAELEDELDFDVGNFNRAVITPEFDGVVAKAFAKQFDPSGKEKALVFCVNLEHADRFKSKLDKAFKEEYQEDYKEESVQILVGTTDKVDDKIKRYKNEGNPSVAITVDLLTTGIDVPTITHLLFMRRVKSRILYEQMKGRATRRCDDIGKTVFYIHDPVGLYESLEDVDTMKPIVKDVNISLEQLVEELHNEGSYNAPGVQDDTSHADDVLAQLSQKIMRVTRKAQKLSEDKPELKQKLDELHQLWQVEPSQLHKHLVELGPEQATEFLTQNANLLSHIEQLKRLVGTAQNPIFYAGADTLLNVSQGYGVREKKPGDYLQDFNAFIKEQLNQHAALKVVCTKPADLTREQLREVRILLDGQGYNEAYLKSAWRNNTNQEIASSIIGFIRQAALGEPLIAFEDRVKSAMAHIARKHSWSKNQQKWLDRLAKQLVHDVIIDQTAINERFSRDGGYKRFNTVMDGELDSVITEIKSHLWSDA